MTSRRRTTVLAVLVGLLAAAVIASAAVYVLMLRPVGRLDQARTDGLAAATSRAQELFSYTPAGLDAELARARAGVSPEFAAEFGRLQSRLIEPAVRAGLTTQATVVRAAVVRAEP